MYYPILAFGIAFTVLKSVQINAGFIINMAIIGGILAYLYYNSRQITSKKKDLALKISAKEETQLEHIDTDTFNYIEQLSSYTSPSIHEAIVSINHFYGDLKQINRSSLIKANDNRRHAINLLLSDRMSSGSSSYMTLVENIKTKTERDYRNSIINYNKLEKYGPNDSPISIDEPEAKDYYFNQNFSLV